MLRGGLLAHGVNYDGGQRISIAHFMHAYTLAELGLAGPPLNSTVPPPGWEDVSSDESDNDDDSSAAVRALQNGSFGGFLVLVAGVCAAVGVML